MSAATTKPVSPLPDAPAPRKAPAAQKSWVHFVASRRPVEPPFVGSLVDGRITRYDVDSVHVVKGRGLAGLGPGWRMVRIESADAIRASNGEIRLEGVTEHLLYTSAEVRTELTAASTTEAAPLAVVIPIVKSPAWWQLAQDERQAHFQRKGGPSEGHVAIGLAHAGRIARKLYHSRYLPGSEWDFVTYFEFKPEHTDDFRALLAALRDPVRNPEWRYVERETEIWLKRV